MTNNILLSLMRKVCNKTLLEFDRIRVLVSERGKGEDLGYLFDMDYLLWLGHKLALNGRERGTEIDNDC
jgi:hypothetical protein